MNIPESNKWEDGIHQISRGETVSGGRDGVANIQAGQLANRTGYLKNEIDAYSALIKSGEMPFTSEAAAQSAITRGEIPAGALFSVRSDSASVWVDEYRNTAGVPVKTGKKLLSGAGSCPVFMTTENDPAGTIGGIAATVSGQFFIVLNGDETGSKALTLYSNNNGSAKELTNLSDAGYLDTRLSEKADDVSVFNVTDALGFSQFYALLSGEFGNRLAKLKPDGVELSAFSIYQTDGGGFYYQNPIGQQSEIVSENGEVAPGTLKADGNGSFGTSAAKLTSDGISFNGGDFQIELSGDDFISARDCIGREAVFFDSNGNPLKQEGNGLTLADRISIMNSENLNYYSKIRSRYNASIERLVFALIHIIWYGQSLSTNQEGYPALSRLVNAALGNLMLGDSPRPNSRTAPSFVPVGAAVLNPLKAVTQSTTGASVLSAAAEAALAAGSPNEGEGAVAAVNMLRTLMLRQMGQMSDPSKSLVLSSCGVNGRTVEQLSELAEPELYNRIREAVSLVKNIATATGKTYGIGALCFLQGEWNYSTSYAGDNTREGYKAKVKKLYSDFVADFCSGQQPPAMYTYQTSASFTSDANELAIGMAQLDMAKEGGNYYGVCPAYPFPDKGGHLTANGYRWMDMFFGKVMFRTLVLGEGWEPLHCISAEVQDNYALLNYAVPYPPLQWGKPYVGRTATSYTDKGYRATDNSGVLAVLSVEIVSDTVVKITFSRPVNGTVKIWYADKTSHNGNGCLMDSDPFIATENYVYTAGSGQYADENIAELVGKPYPLNNWAWAQVITINN